MMTLPNFLIIGAAKAGTTAIHRVLGQHPQIFMCPRKETLFFAYAGTNPDFRNTGEGRILKRDAVRTLKEYESLFEGVLNETAIGETTPRYMRVTGTAERIKATIPHAKLIVILRQPVDRAYSHFLMRRRDGYETFPTFEEAIADEPRRVQEGEAAGTYLKDSDYATQLAPYFWFFSRQQIRVYLYEEFRNRPKQLYRDIYTFLDVDPDCTTDCSQLYNVSGEIANPVLRTLWTRTHSIRNIMRPALPKSVRTRVTSFFRGRRLNRTKLSTKCRKQLTADFEGEIMKLQSLIGIDLSRWLA